MEGIWDSVEKLSTVGFILRTFLVGIILYFASKFLPRRSGGQYAGYDFTFFWMMGGLITSPLFDPKINFTNTLTAAVTIYFLHYFISVLGIKSKMFARIVYGKAEVLIEKGQIQREKMFKSLFPLKLLLSQLREVNVFNLNEVSTAILETNGRVSVQKKVDYWPVTGSDLSVPVVSEGFPIILVDDGKVIIEHVHQIGYDEGWLNKELFKFGAADVTDVYLASIDSEGKIYCSLTNNRRN